MLKPPSRKTAADEAELALFQGIMDGTIPPGTPLRLQDLADQLGMSMMPIREALRRLQGLGLVEIIAHKGAWVRPLTLEDLFDTYATRMHIEGRAIALAATNFSPELTEQAREVLQERADADERGDLIASRDSNERFHFILYEASRSSWLVRSIVPLWRNSERYRVESMRDPENVRRRAAEHEAIIEAVERRDSAEAVSALLLHLQSSVELVATGLADDLDGDARPRELQPSFEEILGSVSLMRAEAGAAVAS